MTAIVVTERARSGDVFEATVGFEGAGEYAVTTDPFVGDPAGEAGLAWYFQEHLRYPFLDKDLERAAVASITDYGRRLYEQLFAASVDCGHEYRRLRDAGFDGVRVEVVGSTAFQRLHWEALRDPDMLGPLGVRVAVVRRVAAVRAGFDVPAARAALNILVVTARPDGPLDAGYRTISRPLLAALRRAQVTVNVDLVRPGTWEALKEHLRHTTQRHGLGWYAITHFDVHGAVLSSAQLSGAPPGRYLFADERSGGGDGGAFVFLETAKDGQAQAVSTAQVADLLVRHRVPVAIFNACQSAMQRTGGDSGEASLAQALAQAGVPVALGMAWSVTVTAAELMMPRLYGQLADGVELLDAITTAREQLFDQPARRAYFDQDLDLADWMLPVTFWQRPVTVRPRAPTSDEQKVILERRAVTESEPRPQYGFVGRDLDVQVIERRLLLDDAQNQLLVRAMAGAGKSTLLAHLGWWWQQTGLVDRVLRFSYEDQAWTVLWMLQTIAARLLDTVEQAQASSLSDDALLELIADRLRRDRHLLVLDNAESITAAPGSIPHSLADGERDRLARFLTRLHGGKTLVLIASRGPEAWLAPHAFASNVYELPGLDPQARSVLIDRILTAHDTAVPDEPEQRDALDELVGLLSGYPLALTVVLPALARQQPTEVLEDLRAGSENADPAGIIQRAIEFSHARLDPATQHALVALTPFTSVIPLFALNAYSQLLGEHQAAAALGPLDLPGAVAQAVGVGLARTDPENPNHASVQPVLPYFLRTRLTDQPDLARALTQAHHDLYQQIGPMLHGLLVSRTPHERATGRALTAAEYANLERALGHAQTNDQPLTPLVWPLEEFLDQTRQHHARRQLIDRAITAITPAKTQPRQSELAGLHNLAGNIALDQHRHGDARTHHQTELELLLEFDDRHSAASTYHQLGRVAQEQRRFEEADQHYRRALELLLEFDDRHSAARTYHQLGTVAQEQRRFEEADQHYRRALELLLEFDDRHNAARTYHQLGILLTQTDRPGPAIAFSLEALQIRYETLGSWSRLDLQWLKRQRRLAGHDAFAQAITANDGQALAESLASLLEQVSEADDADAAPPGDQPSPGAR